jgi:hypothetical protein
MRQSDVVLFVCSGLALAERSNSPRPVWNATGFLKNPWCGSHQLLIIKYTFGELPLHWQATRVALACNFPTARCDIVVSPTNLGLTPTRFA